MTASGAQYDASVPAVDGPNDLALLKAGGGHREPATLRAPRRAILGEPVTVAGFPLSGLLADGLNVTGGEISALAGPANDARVMQITAPVQSGNGGGPPLDKSGRVIGVAVSKPDAPEVYGVTGELPQNIDFAVKGAPLRGFLDIHGVHYRTGDTEIAPSSETRPPRPGGLSFRSGVGGKPITRGQTARTIARNRGLSKPCTADGTGRDIRVSSTGPARHRRQRCVRLRRDWIESACTLLTEKPARRKAS